MAEAIFLLRLTNDYAQSELDSLRENSTVHTNSNENE